MRSFRLDPYLWVHLAGLAALPLFLELCLVGLAIGEPLFPIWFELLFVGGIGILPIFWMQWQRPFSIFSLLFLAVKPKRLTDNQRRILRLFKTPLNRGLALITAIGMAGLLWKLYDIAPLVSPPVELSSATRGMGLAIAAIAFLACNLFLQVPVSVLRVLLTPANQFAALEPYSVDQTARSFTLFGIWVNQILPPLQGKTDLVAASVTAPVSPPAPAESIAPSSPSAPATLEQAPVQPDPAAVVPVASGEILEGELEAESLEAESQDEEAFTTDAEVSSAAELESSELESSKLESSKLESLGLAESETGSLSPDPFPATEIIAELEDEKIVTSGEAEAIEAEPELPESSEQPEQPEDKVSETTAPEVTVIETVIEAELVVESEAVIEAELVSDETLTSLEEVVDLAEAILVPEASSGSVEADIAASVWVEVPVENPSTWVEVPVENPIEVEQSQPDRPEENPFDATMLTEPIEPIEIIEDETVETHLPTPPAES